MTSHEFANLLLAQPDTSLICYCEPEMQRMRIHEILIYPDELCAVFSWGDISQQAASNVEIRVGEE